MNTNKIDKEPPQVLPDGRTLRVCAWCWPGNTIFDSYPWLMRGDVLITHGICTAHKAEFLRSPQ